MYVDICCQGFHAYTNNFCSRLDFSEHKTSALSLQWYGHLWSLGPTDFQQSYIPSRWHSFRFLSSPTTNISTYITPLLSTFEKIPWLKISHSGVCLTSTLFMASLNYVSSVVFMKYSSWWLQHITSYIHPNMPTFLSLYSFDASINFTQLSSGFWNQPNIRFSWLLGFLPQN